MKQKTENIFSFFYFTCVNIEIIWYNKVKKYF